VEEKILIQNISTKWDTQLSACSNIDWRTYFLQPKRLSRRSATYL